METEQAGCDALPYQMEVYFTDFPQLDAGRLEQFINECDPGEDPCTVSAAPVEPGGEIRLEGFTAQLGDFAMMILVHGVPSPAEDTILNAVLAPALKQNLAAHRAFALLSNFGGQEYPPYENQIFLLKMAMAMCEQGAIGAGFPHLEMAFPAELLMGILNALKEGGGDGAEETLWKAIREGGEPFELLASVVRAQASDGTEWLMTRGFAFCGFSDFAYQMQAKEDASDVLNFFRGSFSYLMMNGPVIAAGHTMGYDKNVAFRFSDPPGGLVFPFSTFDRLLVVEKEGEKKKKLFGVF